MEGHQDQPDIQRMARALEEMIQWRAQTEAEQRERAEQQAGAQERERSLREQLRQAQESTNTQGSTLSTPAPTASVTSRGAALPKLRMFLGEKLKYPLWRSIAKNKLELDPGSVPVTEAGKVAYLLSHLDGDAIPFAESWNERHQAIPGTLNELWSELDERFIDHQSQENALTKWLNYRQTKQPFAEFFAEYERLELKSGNANHEDGTRILHLKTRLSGELLTMVITRPRVKNYQEFVQTVAEAEADLALLRNSGALKYSPFRSEVSRTRPTSPRQRQTQFPVSGTPAARALAQAIPTNLDAMDLDPPVAQANQFRSRKPLLPENLRNPSQRELQARKNARACLNCGNAGHFARTCPYARHNVRLNAVAVGPQELPEPVQHVVEEEDSQSENE
jgi:hypothetical protein